MKHLAVLLIALSLNAHDWKLRYSSGASLSGNPLTFVFPSAPESVNYLTTRYTISLLQTQSVTLSVKIDALEGAPSFDYGLGVNGNNCVVPATVRAYIESTVPKKCPGAIYSCAPNSARQWSNPIAIELAHGTFTAMTPLTPDQWSDAGGIRGTDNLAGFAATLSHPVAVGMTFGGGCFFGHGVSVSGGTAQFILRSFTIS